MLIVLGPARMPVVAYQIGRAVREMQKYARAVRDEFSEEWEYLDSQAKEIRGEMHSASEDMREIQRSLRSETEAIEGEFKAADADAQKALPAASTSTNGKSPAPASTGGKPTLSSANVSISGRKPATFPATTTAKSAAEKPNTADRLRAATGSGIEKTESDTGATQFPPRDIEPPAEAEPAPGTKPAEKANKPPLVF
jgi:Sec-independent protein translocase protein TatA